MSNGSRGPQALAVSIFLYIISFIAIGLRFFTHCFILKRFFAEDYVSAAAFIIWTGYTVSAILSIEYGVGSHVVDVSPENRPKAIYYRYIASILYIFLSCLTKWIVGLFLLRICPHRRWRQITIWTLLSIVTIFDIIFEAFAIAPCHPIEYDWTRYNPNPPSDGTCNPTTFATATTYTAAFLNVIVDWVLPILPATLVWKAQLPQREKVSIIVLLCLGSIASVATIVRIPYARGYLDNPDYLFTTADLGIWGSVEIGVALTASSLATIKPLLKQLRLFSTLTSQSERLGSDNGTRPSNNMSSGKQTTVTNQEDGVPAPHGRRESWRNRWPRRGSMDIELVGKNEGAYKTPERSYDPDIEMVAEIDVGLHA
ncbi:hypothetical protein BGZ63DRAFT_471048 [Mariannaea sp. PMI_226]|nr:hypothetical protein BGZ63DRAFT_471048 [Mariannaea sp. PMI_226]